MILSDFERKDSPWIWIQYRLNPKDKKRFTKTKIKKDDPDRKKKVQLAKSQLETHLLESETQSEQPGSEGWGWVVGYLKVRYGRKESSGTLRVYLGQWKALAPFLAAHRIQTPGDLTREHCMVDYVDWRTKQVKKKSRRNPLRNTAIGELKLLGLVMDEAMKRKLVSDNPARRLNLERDESDVKPEITDDEVALIYRELASRPDWMRRSFHIGLQTGLRFAETQIALENVEWTTRTIYIATPKGGRKRAFSIPIYPTIESVLREASGEQFTWSLPPKERQMVGIAWNKFFKAIGLPHLCFHCTRVTFISRGARVGIPESAMMKMVNHASKDIHRIYQRHRPSDALHYHSLLQMPQPSAAGATPQSPHRTASHPSGEGPAV